MLSFNSIGNVTRKLSEFIGYNANDAQLNSTSLTGHGFPPDSLISWLDQDVYEHAQAMPFMSIYTLLSTLVRSFDIILRTIFLLCVR